jgi:hypothetical protein
MSITKFEKKLEHEPFQNYHHVVGDCSNKL